MNCLLQVEDPLLFVVIIMSQDLPPGHKSGHSLLQKNQIPWEPLPGPGAPEARLQVPGKVCNRQLGNKGSRCWVMLCLAAGLFPARSGCSRLAQLLDLTAPLHPPPSLPAEG